MRTLKSLKPYEGGNDLLFALHQLDIYRKHERLLNVSPSISYFRLGAALPGIQFESGSTDQKTVILSFVGDPKGLDLDKGDVTVVCKIIFNEAWLNHGEHEVISTLRAFANMATEIIAMFDHPSA